MEAEKRAAVEFKERGSTEALQSVTYGENQQDAASFSSHSESRESVILLLFHSYKSL